MSLGIELREEEVDEVFNQVDVNGDGDVSLRVHVSGCQAVKTNQDNIP